MYWLKIYEIPDASTVSKGKNISSLISLMPDETVKGFLSVTEFGSDHYVVMATAQGVIKKCPLAVFSKPMSRGIIALGLDEGDELISARLSGGEDYIFIATNKGQAIRFREDQVRPMGRPARGVRSIRLAEGDYVIGMEVVQESDLILSISELGYGKRTPLTKYRVTARGGKGVINMKTPKRVGNVVGVLPAKQDTELMIITMEGKIIRIDASEIRKSGRGASGVRLVRMSETDRVAAACVVPEPIENGASEEEKKTNGQGNLPLQ